MNVLVTVATVSGGGAAVRLYVSSCLSVRLYGLWVSYTVIVAQWRLGLSTSLLLYFLSMCLYGL